MRLSRAGSLPLAVLWALPLLAAVATVVVFAASPESFNGFLAQPQVSGGTLLAVWTGTAATLIALTFAMVIAMTFHATRWWRHVPLITGAALALPHLAFAIGFGLLIMPSGVVARLLVGGDVPPQWVTTQDPYGLSLVAVLVLKEVPFLLLMLWSVMAQGEAVLRFEAEVRAARSLGHGMRSVWLRVLLPQVLRRALWPIVIVWVYGVTVVDLALVIGPTQPPTIGALIWNSLNDVEAASNRQGVAGAVVLVAVLAAIAAVAMLLLRLARPLFRSVLTRGPAATPRAEPALIRPSGTFSHPLRGQEKAKNGHAPSPVAKPWEKVADRPDEGSFNKRHGQNLGIILAAAIFIIYLIVIFILIILSFTPHWPYPALVGEGLSFAAWQRLDASPILLSIGLALATAVAAVAMAVLWFESVRQSSDRWLLRLAITALALPSLTIAAGQYHLLLRLGLTGTRFGLFLVHLTPVVAYAFIVLSGPYRSFDNRLSAAAKSLGASQFRTWYQVKAPLLKAPLLASLAVGFSVSLAQFVPAQLIAAGRYSTLPMEAVTLSSGGNRSLTAAYALALALPALAAFGLSAFSGRPRWR